MKGSARGVVTASHCTNTQGGVESTIFYQPTKLSSNRIGVETIDPAYWTGSPCPSGNRCRYSDSAFAALDGTVSYGRGYIARTTGLGSVTIDANNPRFRISADLYWPNAGVTVEKMGKTTGWTRGTIDRTCANIGSGGITFICQYRATASVQGGDSGSPVFRITNSPSSGDVDLVGIAHSRDANGTAWFSVMGTMTYSNELGSLTDCSPVFTC